MRFLTCIFAFLILVFNFFLLSPDACAWKVPIEVSTLSDKGEKVYNKLVVGKEQDATDGFDNLWDTPALDSHPDPDKPVILRAYLRGNGNGAGGTSRLWKDIRGMGAEDETTWEMRIDSVPEGKSVVIRWDIPQGLFKAGERLLLKDNGRSGADGEAVQVDTAGETNYTYVSGGEDARSLSLVLSEEPASRSRSGSGSGFGCGTVKPERGMPSDGGTVAPSVILLLSPLFFFKLLRLTRSR